MDSLSGLYDLILDLYFYCSGIIVKLCRLDELQEATIDVLVKLSESPLGKLYTTFVNHFPTEDIVDLVNRILAVFGG